MNERVRTHRRGQFTLNPGTAARANVRRLWRVVQRLQREPADTAAWGRGLQLERRLRQLYQTGGPFVSYTAGPWENSSRRWAAFYLNWAGQLRREYAQAGGAWRADYVRSNVRTANGCNKHADYRGLPQ